MNVEGTFAVNRDKVKARTWEELDKKGTKVAVMMGTAEDKALSRVAKNLEIVRLPDQNEARIAVRPAGSRASSTTSRGTPSSRRRTSSSADHPEPGHQPRGDCFAVRKGYVYDDLQALDIMVENYANTGQLKAAQAKSGCPIPPTSRSDLIAR